MNDETEKVFRFFAGTPDAIDVKPGELPTQSLFALCQRGASHLNNEVASAVTAWKKSDAGKGADEAAIEAFASKKRQEKLAKVRDGTLGVRVVAGPRVSGKDAVQRAVTVEVLRKFLKQHELKFPKGDETITVAGKAMDREALIAAMYRRDKAAIDAEVERRTSQAVLDASPDELFGSDE